MSYLNRVTSKETAESFLAELHKRRLLYHPEESAFDCLNNSGIGKAFLLQIERNMKRCFEYLPDPCETALQLLNAASR
jgi:hypothetical protein